MVLVEMKMILQMFLQKEKKVKDVVLVCLVYHV
jgi:hypothetical protein